jgi:arsenate reductase
MAQTKTLRIFEYSNCSTCKNALKFLDRHQIPYEKIPIVDKPPTVSELKEMLKINGGNLKALFNTSGVLYRELGMSEKLPTLSQAEALKLLSENGKLVKRPFALFKDSGLVGFKEVEWKKALL